MRKNDGRKLDHHTLEAIRLRAVEQVEDGTPAAEVGRGLAALGLHPKTIYTWLAKQRTAGRAALRAGTGPGPPPIMSDAHSGGVTAQLDGTSPRDRRSLLALWPRLIVRQLIEARFGVALTVASV